MSDMLSDRGKGQETKFKLDQELEFKVDNRRNKLLGLWLAAQLGLDDADHAGYAKEVVLSDLEEPGIEDVLRKVMKDVADRGADITEADVRAKLAELEPVARDQIIEENS